MNFENFLKALPIIFGCLIGIFAVVSVVILAVILLNKLSFWIANRKSNESEE